MLPPTASWLCLLGLLLHLSPGVAASSWGYDGWVRKYRCDGQSWLNVTESTPFWVSTLTGKLENINGSTQLSVAILAVYTKALFSCDDLDLTTLERSMRLKQLGHSVGKVSQFKAKCPLPNTPELTMLDGRKSFASFDISYELDSTHKLQTLMAEYDFQTQSGHELECAAAKITPYIGPAYSYAFSLMPAGIMALVGAASWQTHVAEQGVNQLIDYSTTMFGSHGLIWDTVLDTGVYLRYLQFIYLSSSVTIEYPGFLPPIVSNIAWTSLLFWKGPYDGGFVFPGVEEGMYVTNGSYGMNYMNRVMGFPRIMDVMFDALLNLGILIAASFAFLCVIYLVFTKSEHRTSWQSAGRTVSGLSAGICLTLFSMPLIALMSNDLMLIGYLPNYRISLIMLTILILVYIHYLITRPFLGSKTAQACSDKTLRGAGLLSDIGKTLRSLAQYLPHFIPLLQAIIVGALQEHEDIQVIALCVSEIVHLLHVSLSRGVSFRFSRTTTVLLSCVRLLVFSLLIAIAYATGEEMRQWIGYVVLCVHGIVVIPGFVINSIWRLYRAFQKRHRGNGFMAFDDGAGHSNSEQGIRLGNLNSPSNVHDRQNATLHDAKHSYQIPHRNRVTTGQHTPVGPQNPLQHHFHAASGSPAHNNTRNDYSSHGFYRKPRVPRNSSGIQPSYSVYSQTSSSGSSRTKTPPVSPDSDTVSSSCAGFSIESQTDALDALSEIPKRPQVDYSFREADLFYGTPVDSEDLIQEVHDEPIAGSLAGLSEIRARAQDLKQTNTQVRWPTFSTNWAKKLPSLVQPKPKEKGFQVVRPGNAALRMARMQQAQRLHSDDGQTLNSHSSSAPTSEGRSPVTNESPSL